ncbi:hypothetical protein ABN034_06765 [Actinopolymorpha sp. B11F2]|uniref:hypothetical protein n=1 Tax=Actinopolymorpha sp. B11F2 TaxID=3160862 RepID=UPI0032E502B5
MLAHLLAAFRRLFTTCKSRVVVGLLIVVTATLPVAEMLVLRLFSSLIIDGPETFTQDTNGAILQIAIFFLAFGLTRGVHHLVRLVRVRVFRDGFAVSGRTRSPSQESWEWALAFELSGVLVSLVQAVMFSTLFLFIDWPTGMVNILVVAVVLALVSAIYRRQFALQKDYIKMGSRPGTVAISQRVGERVRDAEFGAMLASAAMALVLVYMLLRTLVGDISSANAIVLFLGLRLLSGQLGTLSASIMRFARASARRGAD